jgi:hypothetical protein
MTHHYLQCNQGSRSAGRSTVLTDTGQYMDVTVSELESQWIQELLSIVCKQCKMGVQLISDCMVHIAGTMRQVPTRQVMYQHEIIMKRLHTRFQRMSVLNDHKRNFNLLEPNADGIQHSVMVREMRWIKLSPRWRQLQHILVWPSAAVEWCDIYMCVCVHSNGKANLFIQNFPSHLPKPSCTPWSRFYEIIVWCISTAGTDNLLGHVVLVTCSGVHC